MIGSNQNKKYKEWHVNGIVCIVGEMPHFIPKQLVVRFTSDRIGRSLSIADEKEGIMFDIPMDAIIEDLKNE